MGIFSLFGKSKSEKQLELDKTIASEISDFVVSFLLIELMAYDTGNLPDRAKDDWSLGFVSGVVDVHLHAKNLEPSSIAGRLVMIMVFTRIFGSSSYSEDATSLWKSNDAEFWSGMNAGGSDVVNFNNKTNLMPNAWFDHIKED